MVPELVRPKPANLQGTDKRVGRTKLAAGATRRAKRGANRAWFILRKIIYFSLHSIRDMGSFIKHSKPQCYIFVTKWVNQALSQIIVS